MTETNTAPARLSEIGRESRERILDAAEKLFIEQGYPNTSFAAIEREAGISRGSIPWHFQNKAGLLLAVVDRAMSLTALSAHEFTSFRSFFEANKAVLRQPAAALIVALLSESIRPDCATHDQYRAIHQAARDVVIELLESAPNLQLPQSMTADTFAAVVFGGLMGIHQQWRLAPDLVDLDAVIDAFEAMIMSSLESGGSGRPSTADPSDRAT